MCRQKGGVRRASTSQYNYTIIQSGNEKQPANTDIWLWTDENLIFVTQQRTSICANTKVTLYAYQWLIINTFYTSF